MSNIFRNSTLEYFQLSTRDWALLKPCKEATIKLFLATADRMQRYSSPHIAWTTEQQMTEAELSIKSIRAARQELSQKGIVKITEVEGHKGLWSFVLSVPSKLLDLDTITEDEAHAFYERHLPDAIETEYGLQCDCPLHTKSVGIDKDDKRTKARSKGKMTFNVELRRDDSRPLGSWWCHCYGDYDRGQTIDFEQRRNRVHKIRLTREAAHKNVIDFFLALRDKQKALKTEQQEQKLRPRKPYQPNRAEEEENVISAAF